MFCVNFIAVHNNRNRGETHHMFIIIIVSKYQIQSKRLNPVGMFN